MNTVSSNLVTLKPPYKTVFFGTPEFSVPVLEALHESDDFEVIAAVTQPDKPVGRKQILTSPAVKVRAEELGIPVIQPRYVRKKRDEGKAFIEELTALQPDVCVLVAYGKIMPLYVLDIPKKGFINIHGSVLPLLRGASPIQMAIAEGFTETGVTIMEMDAGMDTGAIISTASIPVAERETAATLHDKLSVLGAEELVRSLPLYMAGDIQAQEQNDAEATYCALIQKEDGEIHWYNPPEEIERRIRAFTPWPGCYTVIDDLRIKILEAHMENGKLVIDTVQPAGKKPMSYEDFIKGRPNILLPPQ